MTGSENSNSYSIDFMPVFTGFYGMENSHQCSYMSSSSSSQGSQYDNYCKKHSMKNKCILYPKPTCVQTNRNAHESKHRLEERFQYQKHTENNFYSVQYQVNYVEAIIAMYPYLTSYYYSWLRHAHNLLEHYAALVESNDNISFSSVYGYSRDEEIQRIL